MSELPFLYQTRTILRLTPRKIIRTIPIRCLSQSARSRQSQENLEGSSFFRRKAAAVAATYSDTQHAPNTTTRQELRAFEKLRRFAESQELQASLSSEYTEPDRLDVNPDRILALFTPQPSPEQPESEAVPAPDSSLSSASPTSSSAQLPSLPSADEQTINTAPRFRDRKNERLIQKICTSEIRDFSKAAHEALKSKDQPGDVALYTLIEQRIFPLLDLASEPTRRKKSRKAAAAAAADAKGSANSEEGTPSTANDTVATSDTTFKSILSPNKQDQPQQHHQPPLPPILHRLLSTHLPHEPTSTRHLTPPLPLLTRLYPSLLLLSLRLLVIHHPLSLQTHRLLPEIRFLGPTSYILGATTQFYNTQILLRWSVYSSLGEVCELLAEMRSGGVEFDRGTGRVLKGMKEEREAELAGQKVKGKAGGGGVVRGKEWWLMDEQLRGWTMLEEWRGVVARNLEERGLGEVLREGGPSQSGPGLERNVQEGDVPQVWL